MFYPSDDPTCVWPVLLPIRIFQSGPAAMEYTKVNGFIISKCPVSITPENVTNKASRLINLGFKFMSFMCMFYYDYYSIYYSVRYCLIYFCYIFLGTFAFII